MTGLLQDIRYALRQLRKSPGFTAIAIITLALGIAADTAIFSDVNALVLRPFEIRDLERVVTVHETVPKQNAYSSSVAPANFLEWTRQSTSFEQLAGFRGWNANLTQENAAQRVEGYRVTPEFFPLLGTAPELGRNIGPTDYENGSAPVVVVSNTFWKKNLGGDAGIVGKGLRLNGQQFTVVGVAGPETDFPTGAEAWAPLELSGAAEDRTNRYLTVFGRLKKDVAISQATADLESIARRLALAFPNTNGGHGARVVGLVEDLTGGTRQFVSVLMGAAVFVLLLACVNVTNLQLARMTSRRTEMAVRMGLGASRWQLLRPLLVQSTLLSLISAGLALPLCMWVMALTQRSLPPFIVAHVPGLKHMTVDARVLWFTLVVALATGIFIGLVPALHLSNSQVAESLKDGMRGTSTGARAGRLRALLVVSEVALALVLLVGAGLMVNGFRNLAKSNMGFDRGHVLTFRVAIPEEKYDTKDRIRSYYETAIRQLESLPGVRSVACVTSVPSGGSWSWVTYAAEGRPSTSPAEMPYTLSQTVTPRFFETLRIPLLKGRLISATDSRDSAPVVVISETMARYNWPGQDAIGKHLKLGPWPGLPEREVVGIVGDLRSTPFSPGSDPTAYVPLSQSPPLQSTFVVRTEGDPLSPSTAVVAQLRSIDPDVPPYDVRSLENVIGDHLSGVEFSAQAMLVFGLVALLLAAAGIFGVMAYLVSQRTHEIGVRMALGASSLAVFRVVVISAVRMAGIGIAIGACLSLLLSRALSGSLFGVTQVQVPIFVSLIVLLTLVAGIAAYVPARWATKVDPMVALRYE